MKFKKLNEKIAMKGTEIFGSMWAFYAFFIWGLLGMVPFLPTGFKGFVLLVSSAWIQLWALPLLAVGNTVLNRSIEKRAVQDHETLKKEFELQNKELESLKDIQKDIKELQKKVDIIVKVIHYV